MPAGLNIRFDIWRMTNTTTDDYVGGASISGTIVYHDVMARFQAVPTEQLLEQQGLETNRTFTALMIPGTMDIRERDEAQLVKPLDHVYYGSKFRIMGVMYSDHNKRDPRNYLTVTMTRSVRAHVEQ